MNLRKLILTENVCYKAGKTIVPKGIMVHSTGANNPYLKRYIGPDDELLGKNPYSNHWNQERPDGSNNDLYVGPYFFHVHYLAFYIKNTP
jgi:N-acetylmuramoyl-L-alanine amidase